MPIDAKILQQLRDNDASLKELKLDNKGLTDADILELCAALKTNTTLSSLSLGNSKIGAAGAQALAKNTTLRSLNLYNNQIGAAGAQALAKNTTLSWLNLFNNQIGDAGAQALAKNTTLRSLILWSNQIGDAGAQALAKNTTLSELNLWSNQIGDAGAQALAKNTTLSSLNLGSNQIGAAGAQALAQNTTLSKLVLGNNQIGDAGAKALAKNTTLSELDLGMNKIGDAGAQALAKNTTLSELDLDANQIGDFGAQALAQNTTLSSLALSRNQIGAAAQQSVNARQEQNQEPSKALIRACQANDTNQVKILLAQGVRPYGQFIQEQLGQRDTLLHLAIRQQNLALLTVLLPNNPDKYAKNEDGLTYTQLAQQLGFSLSMPTHHANTIVATTPATPLKNPTSAAASKPTAAATTQPLAAQPIVKTSSTSTSASSSSAKNNRFDSVVNTTTSAQPSPSKATTPPAPQIAVNNSLLTNPLLQQHLAFLNTLPQENLNALTALGQQGISLNHLLRALTDFKTTQANLTQRLQAVEIHTGLDAQTQAEIAYIKKNEHLNRYYQALKMLLGQTFLAAKVIASGDVDASQGTTTTVVNGISTVAGAVCPPAAPFLSFAASVVGIADGIDSYRSAQMLSSWIDLQYIAQLAETIARQLTIAQEPILTRGLTPQAQNTIKAIQNKCTSIVERIKSGQVLNIQESRALLDANELLSYMKENKKPRNADLPKCVAILLPVIMGGRYVHSSSHIVTAVVQQSNVNVLATIIPAPVATSAASQHDVEQLQKELAALKAEREAEKQSKQEQEKQLQTLHRTVQDLQARQSLMPAQTTSNTDVSVGNGPQVFLQKQAQEQAGQNSSSAPAAVLSYVYERVKEHDVRINHLTEETIGHRENISSLQKTEIDGKNKVANSSSGSNREQGKNKSCCMM